MPEILAEDINPYHTRRASLLAEAGNVYLYLSALPVTNRTPESFIPPTAAAVWVANLGSAPERLEPGHHNGRPPVMGRSGTAFPLGCPPPRGKPELVWFEEGDGVALVDDDGLLAVIPAWGGRDGFSGYARYCASQTPLAWPLGAEARTTIEERIAESRRFWSWRLNGGWDEVERSGLAHLDARIGRREAVWRVDGGSFPEMTASRHRLGDHPVWITSSTGISAQRMPQMDQFTPDPPGRIELAVACRSDDDHARNAVVGPASIPFSRMTWLGEGHIIDGQSETSSSLGPDVVGVLLTADPPTDAEHPLPDLSGLHRQGEEVTWLWVLGLDRSTLAIAQTAGSRAVLDALASAGRSWIQ